MVAGLYRFQLEVKDEQGASSRDTVSVVIQDDPDINSRIRMELDVPFSQVRQLPSSDFSYPHVSHEENVLTDC